CSAILNFGVCSGCVKVPPGESYVAVLRWASERCEAAFGLSVMKCPSRPVEARPIVTKAGVSVPHLGASILQPPHVLDDRRSLGGRRPSKHGRCPRERFKVGIG